MTVVGRSMYINNFEYPVPSIAVVNCQACKEIHWHQDGIFDNSNAIFPFHELRNIGGKVQYKQEAPSYSENDSVL